MSDTRGTSRILHRRNLHRRGDPQKELGMCHETREGNGFAILRVYFEGRWILHRRGSKLRVDRSFSIKGDGRGTGLEVIRRRVLKSGPISVSQNRTCGLGRHGCFENDQTILSKIRSSVLEL